MAMPNPIISIITPTFNRSMELDFLIQSINKQTLDNKYFEMIICDDGSTDDTYDRVPSCTTIEEAKQYIAKYNINDSKRYAGYKLNTITKR